MTVSHLNRRSLPWPALLTFVLAVGCVLWAFGNTLTEMYHAWRSPQASHGYLVPFFALYLLWHRRDQLATGQVRPNWLGLPLVAAGIALHLIGAYYYYVWIDHVSLLPTLAGVWLTCGGKVGWRWGWPSILFLVFMIPLPYRYAIALSGPLQRLATVVATFVMQCCGMPALAEGNVIKLNEHDLDVAEACSGLRMLIVFFALSTAVVLLYKRHWLDRLILVLSAVPIALASNVARIIVTGILWDVVNNPAVNAWVHDAADWLMMPLALGLLWAELRLLNHLFIPLPPAPPRGPRPATPRRVPQPQPARKRTPAPALKRPAATRPPAKKTKQTPAAAPAVEMAPAQPAERTTVETGEAKP
jgi:exosortase